MTRHSAFILAIVAGLGCSGGESECTPIPGHVYEAAGNCLRMVPEVACSTGEVGFGGTDCASDVATGTYFYVSSVSMGTPRFTGWQDAADWMACSEAGQETTTSPASICDDPDVTEIGLLECPPVDGACPEGCHSLAGSTYDPAAACVRAAVHIACSSALGGPGINTCGAEVETGRIAWVAGEFLGEPYFAGWTTCTVAEEATFASAPACE